MWGAHDAPLLLCLREHWEFFILAWLPPLPLLSPPFPSQQPSGLPPPSQLVYAQKIQLISMCAEGDIIRKAPSPRRK